MASIIPEIRSTTSSPGDVNATLALATAKLRAHDPDACDLFASITSRHEVREAWLGLALAHHLRAEPGPAGQALAHALSRHAITTVPPLADDIAASVGKPGWCALNGAGFLTVRPLQPPPRGARMVAILDGKPLRLLAQPGGRLLTARLPTGWHSAGEIRVALADVDLIGSPIILPVILRVEGFLDTADGDLHGWVWCPHDPDRDPVLTVVPVAGGPGITIIADDRTVEITTYRPLARPRGFRIPPAKLQSVTGPVRVRGCDGRDLTGSPLDPSEERRSAAAASRIVAGLFPAPGRPVGNPGDGRLQSAPAHVVGGPVEVSCGKKRPVDIVIPVYGGLDHTLACIQSALADLPSWARVVVVDDASPDPRIGKKLGELAARRRITLLTQTMNRGFPATANVGMRHDATRDVVLLNSDTLTPPGWLAQLRQAAYAAPDIGSATPLSNDGTILSYPSVEHDNAIPSLSETIGLDALARKANAGLLVDIPTAVGFCVYIKRDCLNATGLLREDVFAQGYGEENDLCIRARHLGWRHVAVPGVFVAHIGGQSFGAAKHYLIERNMRMLNKLHPGYDALIHRYQRVDPMADARRRLDLERWKTFRSRKRSVLLVTHGRAGGVQRHVAERAEMLRQEGLRPIILWPVASRDGEGRDCVLGNGPAGGTPNLRFSVPGELGLLARILKADHPVRAEVHHLIGHNHQLLELFGILNIPYEMVIHDYSSVCPRINLVGPDRRYCGEPDLDGCDACIADGGTLNDEQVSTRAVRERSAGELAAASSVAVPSRDVATRLRRYFPSIVTRIGEWEDDTVLPPPELTPVAADGVRRVCVVGAIGIEKGYDMLLACARDVADRRLGFRFHLVGHSCDDARLLATGVVQITGRYEEHNAVALIRRQQAQLVWLPAIWPETWCYTLSQAWWAGLNVLAFDIGAPADRIRQTGRGWLCPLGLSPPAINRLLLEKTLTLRSPHEPNITEAPRRDGAGAGRYLCAIAVKRRVPGGL